MLSPMDTVDYVILILLALACLADAVATGALLRILWLHTHDEDSHLPLRDR